MRNPRRPSPPSLPRRTATPSFESLGEACTRYDEEGGERRHVLAHERDGHWLGADALACNAAGGVGGVATAALMLTNPQEGLQNPLQPIDLANPCVGFVWMPVGITSSKMDRLVVGVFAPE